MGSQSWWTRALCFLLGHRWELGFSAAAPRLRTRHCTREGCGAAQVRDVPGGGRWYVP